MNNFLKIAKEHQAELERLSKGQEIEALSYFDAGNKGLLKTLSARLPVDVIAKIEFIQTTGFWSSKQEVIYDMVCSSVDDFYNESSEDWKITMDSVAKKALDSLNLVDKAKNLYQARVFPTMTGEEIGSGGEGVTEDEFVKLYVEGNSTINEVVS
jgi:hypothetical protein